MTEHSKIGRPKGSRNKTLKLDAYRDEIMKYLKIGVSRGSIAKLLQCNSQTLYNYLKRNDLNKENNNNKGKHGDGMY